VKEILREIDSLGQKERAQLEREMARRLERQWITETLQARTTARRRKIDQTTIDKAIQRRRYGR
jgi:hypothetical protein